MRAGRQARALRLRARDASPAPRRDGGWERQRPVTCTLQLLQAALESFILILAQRLHP